MIGGFNDSVKYRGGVYNIQTEDGGIKNPFISTVVFKEGRVVASKKISYADIIKFERLDMVVRDLMKEQHMTVVRGLQSLLHKKEKSEIDKR